MYSVIMIHKIQKFILENVKEHPKDVTRLAEQKFKVSRTAVYNHVKKLKESNLIIQKGSRNQSSYFLAEDAKEALVDSFEVKVGKLDEDEIWKKEIKHRLGNLKENILDICKYGFTEMFNNVIDHSKSNRAVIEITNSDDSIKIRISDFGIGVFKNIASHFEIEDLRDAVIRLHQGKVTTDGSRHTGQGIFFTSKVFDKFSLTANGYFYFIDNSKEDEWYWESRDDVDSQVGTSLLLQIDKGSSRVLKDVFDMYTNDDFSFDKSHFRIELGKYEEDSFVSRSQAKRLLAGLGKFRTIILDFKHIRNVGQGFVDEMFGVFGLEHPEINFQILNSNDDILFMIRRGLRDRNMNQNRIEVL